jgi:polysaccharide export outer membrane protein
MSAAIVVVAAASALAAQDGRGAGAKPAASATPSEVFRIGPEDVLDISVWNNAALSRVVPVRPDGKISLPLLDDVQAAGLTAVELRDALNRRFVEFIPTPEVSVVVREVRSFKVSVLGQVKTPGRYELRSRATILDVLALAGGFADFADKTRLLIVRQDGNTTRRYVFNYTKFVSGDDVKQHPFLQPGDVIVVP